MSGFPDTKQWVGFLIAVFVAGAVINSIARRVPTVAQLGAGF